MATLTKAHDELFRRTLDEAYQSFDDLYEHCSQQRMLFGDNYISALATIRIPFRSRSFTPSPWAVA